MNSIRGSSEVRTTTINPGFKKILIGGGLVIAISAFVIGILAILATSGVVNIQGLNAFTIGALMVVSFAGIVLAIRWYVLNSSRQNDSAQNVNNMDTDNVNQNQEIELRNRENELLAESWRLHQTFRHYARATGWNYQREKVLTAAEIILRATPPEGERNIAEAARFYGLERTQAIIYLMLMNQLQYAYHTRNMVYCSRTPLSGTRRIEIEHPSSHEGGYLIENQGGGNILYTAYFVGN